MNAIHPALTIAVLAGVTVLLTSEFKKRFTTKRYQRLEEEFRSWYTVRQQALECSDDPAKGKQMAKNIDQALVKTIPAWLKGQGLQAHTSSITQEPS